DSPARFERAALWQKSEPAQGLGCGFEMSCSRRSRFAPLKHYQMDETESANRCRLGSRASICLQKSPTLKKISLGVVTAHGQFCSVVGATPYRRYAQAVHSRGARRLEAFLQ